nr:MAG TPA: tail tape measure [Caudoviricetes sp.]
MATIRTAIMVEDRMSSAFRAMNNALNIVVNSFADLQDATHQGVDVSSIQAARTELARAEATLTQVEDSIRSATQQQENFNRTVQNGGSGMERLVGKVKSLIGTYVGMRAIESGMNATDAYISRQARLGLIVDVDDTAVDAVQQKIEATAELQDQIFAAAQRSRGEYGAIVDNVAKLGLLAGDAFNDTSEIVAFTETMQKAFKISGASTSEATNAMYQLNQAMASGRLQGDEYRSIIENAPLLAQAIADYCGVSRGELKELSSAGAISADVVKAAVFNMAEDVEQKFAEMPMRFSDVWTSIKNTATYRAQEVMGAVNAQLNSNTGQAIIQGINNSIGVLINTLGMVLTMVMAVSGFFVDNWSIIEPIIWGVVGALVVYNATMGVAWLTTLKNVTLSAAHAVAIAAQTASTIAFTVATRGLNAALAMCPINWIIIAIVALIAIFYAAVAAVNKFAGTSYSATGIIVGLFTMLGAFIANSFLIPTWNGIAAFVNFFANVWNDPIGSVKVLFYDMCLTVIGYINNMAHAIEDVINKIPGVTVDITSGLDSFQSQIESASQKVKDESEWKEYVKSIDYIDYGEAYNKGYNFGKGIDTKIDSMFNFEMLDYEPADYSSLLSDIGAGIGDTAKNTGKTADNTDTTKEDLKYLRDIAERETINRFTTAEIKVDIGGVNNTVNNMNDLDGIADYLAVKVEEQMQIAAEGVHE